MEKFQQIKNYLDTVNNLRKINRGASFMKSVIIKIIRFVFVLKEINIALARGALSASVREVDRRRPLTWQFSAFSQNGEDGILDYLVQHILKPNRFFIEIGSANGLANNTAYLAFVRKYCGIMVEGGKLNSFFSKITLRYFNRGVTSINMFVTNENLSELLKISTYTNPDVFTIDIDGNDYYLVQSIFEAGYRPKIFIVEYNANYGPDKSITIQYSPFFDYSKAHPTRLYFGVSIMAWRNLFSKYGYQFITVDSNGINAFFICPADFSSDFIEELNGEDFVDNVIEMQFFKKNWRERFKLIENMPYYEV